MTDYLNRFTYTIMNKVAELGDGFTFGEIALMTSQAKRNASIKAKTECHFAVNTHFKVFICDIHVRIA